MRSWFLWLRLIPKTGPRPRSKARRGLVEGPEVPAVAGVMETGSGLTAGPKGNPSRQSQPLQLGVQQRMKFTASSQSKAVFPSLHTEFYQ